MSVPEEPGVIASSSGAWRPVLSGADANDVLDLAGVIAGQVEHAPLAKDPSVSGGSAGLALFLAFSARGEGTATADDAWRHLDSAIEAVAAQPMGVSFYAGLTGVAWATELIGGLLDPGGEDRSEAIDEALAGVLRRDWNRAPYDLIGGLVGLGVYSLERGARPLAVENTVRVVDLLAGRASGDDHGLRWWTDPAILPPHQQQEHPSGGVDLGVAHGVAGVVAFLARVAASGRYGPAAADLLDRAAPWLMHAAAPDRPDPIPYFLDLHHPPAPARAAWCYGDPGVAAALLLAGRAAGEAEWEEAAVAVARRAARRPPEEAGVVDAWFCHGTAGLAHLFNRLHQATGDDTLAEAARFWLARTLSMCSAPGPSGVDDGAVRPASAGPGEDIGVLEGAAGVGLVLLAATTPVEPIWDRMFLLSGPEIRLWPTR